MDESTNERTPRTTRAGSRLGVGIALAGAVVGFALLVVAIGLEWRGFGGGVAIGAGVGMVAAGMYLCGFAVARSRWHDLWLPSRSDAQ